MMNSILDLHDHSETPQPDTVAPLQSLAENPGEFLPEPPREEFEFVLGRRQMAGLAFVFMVVLAVSGTLAFLAGKSSVKPAPAAVESPAPSTEPPPIVLQQEPPPALSAPEPPLFGEPKVGALYIQMGAVDKGVAAIFAEGLRRKGLPGFVAPGPTDKIFRVLIGPLPDSAAYQRAKTTVDQLGLTTFARQYPY